MIVAARSSSECAASDRIASEPVAAPTTPLASVSAPDAAIDDSATLCLMSCMCGLGAESRSRDERGRQPVVAGRFDANSWRHSLPEWGRCLRCTIWRTPVLLVQMHAQIFVHANGGASAETFVALEIRNSESGSL